MFEPNNFYHIYNRGNNREDLFKEERNYVYFLQLWARYLEPFVETHAYALLPNHFHVVFRIRPTASQSLVVGGLSKAFASCFKAYAQAVNVQYGRTGSLFQKRFRRKHIDTDQYLHNAICYVNTNAQKHGFARDFVRYPHTSYASILSDRPTLLARKAVLAFFDGREGFVHWHRQYADLGFATDGLLEEDGDDS